MNNDQILFIILGGGTSGGKTTLCQAIQKKFDHEPNGNGLRGCTIVHGDNYYLTKSEFKARQVQHFDCAEAFEVELLEKNLLALKESKSAVEPVYSMKISDRTSKTVILNPAKLVVVEGILVLAMEKIRKFAPRSIFIKVELDEMLRRRVLRDTLPEEEGGRGKTVQTVCDEWPFVKEGHLKYVLPTREFATMTLDNSFLVKGQPKAISELLGVIDVWMKNAVQLNQELL